MNKVLSIEGKEVGLKVSAFTPTKYQTLFTGKDIFDDFNEMQSYLAKNRKIDGTSRAIIERMAYTMAKQYDDSIPEFEEWLDSFENPMLSVDIAMDIVGMWIDTNKTSVESKKK